MKALVQHCSDWCLIIIYQDRGTSSRYPETERWQEKSDLRQVQVRLVLCYIYIKSILLKDIKDRVC